MVWTSPQSISYSGKTKVSVMDDLRKICGFSFRNCNNTIKHLFTCKTWPSVTINWSQSTDKLLHSIREHGPSVSPCNRHCTAVCVVASQPNDHRKAIGWRQQWVRFLSQSWVVNNHTVNWMAVLLSYGQSSVEDLIYTIIISVQLQEQTNQMKD